MKMWNFFKLFMFFAPDDGATGGGQADAGEAGKGAADAGKGADDGGEKPDYQKQLGELQEKYKGVDLDKWGKVKDLDPDKAIAALKAQEEREAAEDENQEKPNADDEDKDNKKNPLETRLERLERQEQQRVQDQWMQKFDTAVETEIASAIKSDDYKDLGELSPGEKKLVVTLVNKAYDEDSRRKTPKLNLRTVAEVVKNMVKEVKEDRAWHAQRNVKGKGPAHPATKGGPDAGAQAGKPMSDSERMNAMVEHYKTTGQEGQV